MRRVGEVPALATVLSGRTAAEVLGVVASIAEPPGCAGFDNADTGAADGAATGADCALFCGAEVAVEEVLSFP